VRIYFGIKKRIYNNGGIEKKDKWGGFRVAIKLKGEIRKEIVAREKRKRGGKNIPACEGALVPSQGMGLNWGEPAPRPSEINSSE